MDFTAYTVELPSNQLELIIKLESDRMKNLDINLETLNLERGAILNERVLRVDDEPNGFSWELLLNNIYKDTSYQHDTIGSEDDIKSISVEDCNAFYNKYYAPNNATIVITGDFNENDVLNLIDVYFSPIKSQSFDNKNEILKNNFNSLNIVPNNKIIEKEFDILSDKFLIGYLTPKFIDDDFFKLKLLSIILTDVRSSFFKKEYIDTNKLISINTDLLYLKNPSLFVIDGILKKIDKDDILNDLDEKLSYFIENISEMDLLIAKNKFKIDLTVSLSTNYRTSSLFGESISLTGTPFYVYDKLSKIDEILISDIKSVYHKYIVPKNRVSILLLKRKDDKI
jgi:zinc protease